MADGKITQEEVDNAAKTGIKTSEFWIVLVGMVLVTIGVGVAESFGLSIGADQIAGAVAFGASYVLGRSVTKGQILKALPENIGKKK